MRTRLYSYLVIFYLAMTTEAHEIRILYFCLGLLLGGVIVALSFVFTLTSIHP